MVGNQVMVLRIDSGSSHTFVTKSFADRAGCRISPAPAVPVKIANGQFMQSDSQVLGLQWFTQGHTFVSNMRILDLGAYDAVLGMDWLKQCGRMTVDWSLKTLEFVHEGQQILLRGNVTRQQTVLQELSSVQLQKWLAGNEVWAMAVIDQTSDSEKVTITPMSPDLQSLLDEYEDVFATPSTLPPHRQLDHAITLEPITRPTNSRPYRYSPLQKDEIERQVNDILNRRHHCKYESLRLSCIVGQEERLHLAFLCRLSQTQRDDCQE